ncbi:hypothetical protein A9264_05355 [Vibrio sp. UCD-FRSSP16_10]|uniref:hypothetical protein n=1 Tax=unclassified Vibrio TaxID=2614977 RepID=UPI0008024EA9|nr:MULTISPECIES: hypothetical protein [unclassified Vibrio]OBT07898.1 hypothetical protein A9260_07595 [Vibrio sp. UCD-FRSSP16_30]OBT17074.1 hypothetical protein A9264_05355 [Vibrio sp. UCD-FRSSP16_10]
MIDKEQLRQELLQILTVSRQNALSAADSAHDDATHEQSVAETQYDTVAIEAAYLAHGQSKRVAECDEMINTIKSLFMREFTQDDEIALGALVTVDNTLTCWLLPVCGGFKLKNDTIVVVTPQAPLGKLMMGAELEDTLSNGKTITALL